MRLRLRLAKQGSRGDAPSRRPSFFLVGGEQLQQFELLQRREARSLLHRPLGAPERRGADEGSHCRASNRATRSAISS
eukprot:622578-Prymnesium_polylepis.1